MGKRRRPRPINHHAAPKAAGYWARGASHSPLRFSAKPSLGAPWARGLLSVFWERGSLDLPTCSLRRVSSGGPIRPIFINSSSRPSRGVKPRGADDARLPQERPHQAGSQGGREIKAGASRGARDASHDDRDQAGARRASACTASLFPLWCKGGKHRRGVLGHQSKVTISVQRDKDQQSGRGRSLWSPRRRHHQCLWQPKTNFSQDNLY